MKVCSLKKEDVHAPGTAVKIQKQNLKILQIPKIPSKSLLIAKREVKKRVMKGGFGPLITGMYNKPLT